MRYMQSMLIITSGKRCPLKYTRAILDAIHSGELAKVEFETYDTFGLSVPKTCPNVPDELLNPAKSWNGTADFKGEVEKLGKLFMENFKKYEDQVCLTPQHAAQFISVTKFPGNSGRHQERPTCVLLPHQALSFSFSHIPQVG